MSPNRALLFIFSMKGKYFYKGPVKMFEDTIDQWEASTIAASKKQALNNLTYRYKKEHKYLVNTRITLNPNYISLLEEYDDYDYYDDKMKNSVTPEEYVDNVVSNADDMMLARNLLSYIQAKLVDVMFDGPDCIVELEDGKIFMITGVEIVKKEESDG